MVRRNLFAHADENKKNVRENWHSISQQMRNLLFYYDIVDSVLV
jgi:hypothetical protein